jgi:hypothetical protein
MIRKLLLLLLASIAAVAAAAPAASADQVIAADVIAKHNVVWDYKTAGVGDDCKHWSKGSGTQTLSIHSLKREKLRLEHAFGRTFLSGMGQAGTFEGSVNRVGTWDDNVPANVQPCSPCGPQSEYGPCDDAPPTPTPLKFECGHKDLRGAQALISYKTANGLPSLDGLTVTALFRNDVKFPKCPPDLPRGFDGPDLQAPWPGFARLPPAQLKRLTSLGVGDSVVAEVRVQRSYVESDGKVTKGDNCIKAPDVATGYTECAITDYSVTFTRLS